MPTLIEFQEMLRNIPMGEVQSILKEGHPMMPKSSQLLAMDEVKRRGEMQKIEEAQQAESGLSVEGAYSNAVSAVRSGAVAGKFNDKDALRKLQALGHDVVPPTTSWVFDFGQQKAVKVSERTLRQNPDKYGPPLSSVNGKLSENYFNAGMAMLMADLEDPDQVNPMTFDILYYYQLNGLSKLREEDVALMGRWSAAAQALRSAARPATSSELDDLRTQLRGSDEEDDDTDVRPAGS